MNRRQQQLTIIIILYFVVIIIFRFFFLFGDGTVMFNNKMIITNVCIFIRIYPNCFCARRSRWPAERDIGCCFGFAIIHGPPVCPCMQGGRWVYNILILLSFQLCGASYRSGHRRETFTLMKPLRYQFENWNWPVAAARRTYASARHPFG